MVSSRNALRWYFAAAFGISWSGVALAASGGSIYVMFAAMLAGPAVASLALTAALDGRKGLRDLGRRLLRWRIGGRWYAALLLAPALVLIAVSALAAPTFMPAYALIAGLGAGFFEELGWTGFATPRLLRRTSWLKAGVLLGLPWAVWHILPDYLGRAAHGPLWVVHVLEWVVALVAFRVFMTWIYSRTGSLALGMLLHASLTGSHALLAPVTLPLELEVRWYALFAAALSVAVPLVILASKRFASIGASPDEKERGMPGDHLVPDAMFTVTHAITIAAPPERVWPWLAQLGSGRGGWYSWDRIDNGGRRSAERVLDQYQQIAPGDVLPALPAATDVFVVAVVDPPRDLVLTVPGEPGRGPTVSWEHLVEALDGGRSRLIVRGRVSRGWKQMARGAHRAGQRPVFIEYVYRVLGTLPDFLMMAPAGLGHRWMEARHLRGIRRRAEAALA